MNEMQMRSQDLLELYQLLERYERTYGNRKAAYFGKLQKEIEEKYKICTRGEDIRQARNPRGAGRKRKYTEKENERIRELRKNGDSLRKISQTIGCSVGHVQDVIKV